MPIVLLSHILDNDTPLYGGSNGLVISSKTSIARGDSANTSVLTLPNHAGTHVDTPLHFLQGGKSVDEYTISTWFFKRPRIIFLEVERGQLLTRFDMSFLTDHCDSDTDLLLLRSGFEQYRGTETYWKEGPGLTSELAGYLTKHMPNLRAVGVDFLSISSFTHRAEGRAAHKAFLEKGILLLEDMALKELLPEDRLKEVIALPLLFKHGDGAPCTVVGIKS